MQSRDSNGRPPHNQRGGYLQLRQLVFTGELDASLSGLAGYKTEMLYANARNVVFRNAGHAQVALANYPPKTVDDYRLCALRLARQFFADPQRRLDTSCTESRKLRLVQ